MCKELHIGYQLRFFRPLKSRKLQESAVSFILLYTKALSHMHSKCEKNVKKMN